MKFAKVSLVLLGIQLVLVGSIAAKYLYQRDTCPKVWVKTAMYDPNLPVRGRYMSLQLTVDGCDVVKDYLAKKGPQPPSSYEPVLDYDLHNIPVALSVAGDKLVAHTLTVSMHRLQV